MQKTVLTLMLSTTFVSQSFSLQNIAFLNNPSPSDVANIGKYVVNTTNKPFFTDVVLFAANINGTDPNSPT